MKVERFFAEVSFGNLMECLHSCQQNQKRANLLQMVYAFIFSKLIREGCYHLLNSQLNDK